MKRLIILAVVLSVGISLADWRGRFDEQFAAAVNAGTPIPAVAWYKLDGNALDSSGNGRNGTWGGTPTYADGRFAGSQAASLLRGRWINTGHDFADAGYLFAGPGVAWTVAWWQLSTNQISAVINYSPNGALAQMNLLAFMHTSSEGPTPRIVVRGASTDTWALAYDSSWHHFAVRWDGTAGAVVKDGETIDALRVGNLTNVVGTLFLGTSASYSDAVKPLKIDDVRVYDRALSEDNIQRIMESQDNEPLEELQ